MFDYHHKRTHTSETRNKLCLFVNSWCAFDNPRNYVPGKSLQIVSKKKKKMHILKKTAVSPPPSPLPPPFSTIYRRRHRASIIPTRAKEGRLWADWTSKTARQPGQWFLKEWRAVSGGFFFSFSPRTACCTADELSHLHSECNWWMDFRLLHTQEELAVAAQSMDFSRPHTTGARGRCTTNGLFSFTHKRSKRLLPNWRTLLGQGWYWYWDTGGVP